MTHTLTFKANLESLSPAPQILPGRKAAIPRVAKQDGINIGIYIVVPDVDNQPMHYHRLTSTEVWHDSLGYYYLNNRERYYLPGRP